VKTKGRATATGRLIPVLLSILLLAVCRPIAGLANGPTYMGDDHPEVSWLQLEYLHGRGEFENRGIRSRSGGFEHNENITAPGIGFDAGGSLYHPSLLTFRSALALSYQLRKTSGATSRSDNVSFRDYDLSATLLGDKKFNLTGFANGNNAWMESAYRTSTRQKAAGKGLEMNYQNRHVPMTLSWSDHGLEEDFPDLLRTTDQNRVRFSARHQADLSRSRLSWRFVDYQRNQQPQDYETVTTDISNTLGNLRDHHLQLRTSARYFHQYGSFNRKQLNASGNGTWQPIEDVSANLNYLYNEQHGGGEGDDLPHSGTHATNLSARHSLYGSLTSIVRMNILRENRYSAPSAGNNRIGSRNRESFEGRLEYQRNLAWGRIHLNYSDIRGREDNQAETRTRSTSNEAHQLTDGNEPRLLANDVDLFSVVVSDVTGFIIYVADLDYRLVEIGGVTFIFREPGGDIEDGDTVQVDYTSRVSPDLVFDTFSKAFGTRLDLQRGYSFYTRHVSAHDAYVSGTLGESLRDQSTALYGLEVEWRRFSLSQEYEKNSLRESEYNARRSMLRWSDRLLDKLHVSLGGQHTRTEHIDRDQTFRYTQFNLRVSGRIAHELTMEAESWTRFDRGEGSGVEQNSDLTGHRLRFVKQLRAMRITAGLFYRNAFTNGSRDKRLTYNLGITREF
jgi:hypothetical protein